VSSETDIIGPLGSSTRLTF